MAILDKIKTLFGGSAESLPRKPLTSRYESFNHWWGNRYRDLPPFDYMMIRDMLFDPTIRLGLAMRSAPLQAAEIAYKEGDKWLPGVECREETVKAFLDRQIDRIWSQLEDVTNAQVWGWSGGEITYRLTDHKTVEIDRLLPRHANDVRAITSGSELCGIRVYRVKSASGGYVDLSMPRCWFHSYCPEDGQVYSEGALIGAYSPWYDKQMNGGAVDVRRLFMHKNAYGGDDITYPEGSTYIPDKGEVSNRDIARELVEQLVAGGVTARPSTRDEKGNEKWALTRAVVPASPMHILQYPKDLDVEMLRGLEIPDDVLTAEASGSWEGKKVPMAAFYSSLDRWLRRLLRDITSQILEPLVMLNFGDPVVFNVSARPLADQAMEQSGEQDKQGQQLGQPQQAGNPYEQPNQQPNRMSLRSIGNGDDDATAAVEATLQVMASRLRPIRMANDKNPWKRYKGPKGGTGWKHSQTGDIRYQDDRPGADEVGSGDTEAKPAKKQKLTPEQKRAEADRKFDELMANKSKLDQAAFRRARQDGVAIPPAWTDVVYHGEDKDIIAEGRDDKGRKQRAENPAYRQRISDENNSRITRDLRPRMAAIRKQLAEDAKAGNEESKVIYLIAQTGFRIGGAGDGKAKTKAYGAANLMGDHVSVNGNTVTFDFPGKKGVRQQHTITDPIIAAMVRDATPGEPVFQTKDAKVRKAWQDTYGGHKVHDIRHVIAAETAEEELSKLLPPPPKTKAEKQLTIKQVATVAASKLGNNPSQALSTYIDPDIFAAVRQAA